MVANYGWQPGDILLEIDGTKCSDAALAGMTRLLQGLENSKVVLVLQRQGRRLEVDALRLPPPSARGRRVNAIRVGQVAALQE